MCGNLWWFRFYSLLILEIHYASQKKSSRKRYQSELARRFREDLILDGKEPRSVQSYLAAVAHLAEHFRCSPERLSEEQIRQYLLLRSQTLKRNSMRPILAGIQFFYRVTVPRDWKTLAAARIPKTRTLPAVLMPQQVWRVIEATRLVHFQVFFRTAYTCGLRPGDTRHLTVDDVDSDRMLLSTYAPPPPSPQVAAKGLLWVYDNFVMGPCFLIALVGVDRNRRDSKIESRESLGGLLR